VSGLKDTKANISKEFLRLENFGFIVWNFNSPKPLPKGLSNAVDHVLISNRYTIYVEVKLGTDKLSNKQKDLGKKLSHLSTSNKAIHYLYVTTLKECQKYVNLILAKKL